MRRAILPLAGLFILLAFTLTQCKGKGDHAVSQPAYNPYVSAFTSGTISSRNVIRVLLTNEYDGEFIANEPVKEKLFDFSPSLKGKTYWVDNRIIEIKP